jgi:hypothetical protein
MPTSPPPNHLSNLATKHTEMKGSVRMQCDEFASAGFALHLLSCSSCQDTASSHPGTVGSRHLAGAVHVVTPTATRDGDSSAQFAEGAEGAEGAGHRLRLQDLCCSRLALQLSATGMASQPLPQNNGLWPQPDHHTAWLAGEPTDSADRPRSRPHALVAMSFRHSANWRNHAAGKPLQRRYSIRQMHRQPSTPLQRVPSACLSMVQQLSRQAAGAWCFRSKARGMAPLAATVSAATETPGPNTRHQTRAKWSEYALPRGDPPF